MFAAVKTRVGVKGIAKLACHEFGNDAYQASEVKAVSLSITPEQFHEGGVKIPLPTIQGIWKKAEDILTQSDAIVSAPGHEKGTKMVISRSSKRPHLVKCGKGGRVSCDSDCKSIAICSHCVAVAQRNGILKKYVDFYRKSPNMPQFLLTGLPSGLGNKGNRVKQKRKRTEVKDRVTYIFL